MSFPYVRAIPWDMIGEIVVDVIHSHIYIYIYIYIEVRDYPERDIWSLGVMVQGSGQMGDLLGRRRRRRRRRRRQLKIGV